MSRDDLILLSGGSRFGGDEPDAEYVPKDIVHRSSWQGGYLNLDCTLSRRAKSLAIEQMYAPVRLATKEGETVWSGFLMRPDARTVTGNHQVQSPSAIGWAGAKAERRKDVRWLGIDRDLSRCVGPTLGRQEELIGAGGPYRPSSAGAEAGTMKFSMDGAWATNAGRPAVVAFYDASPLNVGRVLWSGTSGANLSSDSNGQVLARNADGLGGSTALSDWVTTAGVVQAARDVTINKPAVEINLYYPTAGVTTEDARYFAIKNLCFVGDHGIPLVGASAVDYGLRASDCLRYLIDQFGGGELRAGHIPTSPFALPHTGLTDWTTLGEAVNALNVYHGYTSAIWDDGEWDFHEYGQSPRSRTWTVSASDTPGIEFNEAGNDGAAIFDRLLVTYQDPSGQQMSVGPVGSTAHEFDDRLQIWDPENPAVQSGEGRTDRLELGITVVKEAAIRAGETYLSQLNQSRRAGTCAVQNRYIRDATTGEQVRTEFIKGGDHLIVTDFGDDTPRRILDVEHRGGAANLTLDDGMQHADQLLAHLQVQRVGRL